jgi:hypothetical protein
MSPTATIAAVVVALVFVAWLFQTDTKDPGYEAWLKRQQEERKAEQAQKASLGIALTDSGVTKDGGATNARRVDMNGGFDVSPQDSGFSITPGDSPLGSNALDTNPGALVPGQVEPPPATRPTQPAAPGFGTGLKLEGTFVGVAYVGDLPSAKGAAAADVPSITFRRNGTFSTLNMASAEVDMEPGSAVTGALDRGSGRYKLYANTLELTYTDGLSRKKGPHRGYTVFPVEGPDNSPTAITIQGKVFKLDPNR